MHKDYLQQGQQQKKHATIELTATLIVVDYNIM